MSDWLIIRDDRGEARRVLDEALARNGTSFGADDHAYLGTPRQIADELRPAVEIGFRHIITDLMRPYDPETIDRLPELREALAG